MYPAVLYIDLHDTKKLDENIERVQAAHINQDSAASLRLLINDYIKGSGTAHHTQLRIKTFTHTHKKKLVEKERQQKKAKYTSTKQQKAKAYTKLSDNLYSVSSAEEVQS